MTCPNCGLLNADSAKFCANCGTALAASGASYQQTPSLPYQPPAVAQASPNSLGKNIAIGCLVVLAIFIFMGLSCTRACLSLGHRRSYIQRRY